MNYVTRILPREEWARLKGTEAEKLEAMTRPGNAEVVVVERDGEIVGCWALLQIVHAECVWVAPEYRGVSAVARRLLAGMRRVARAMGVSRVVTAALTPEVEQLLSKLQAEELPGRHFVMPV